MIFFPKIVYKRHSKLIESWYIWLEEHNVSLVIIFMQIQIDFHHKLQILIHRSLHVCSQMSVHIVLWKINICIFVLISHMHLVTIFTWQYTQYILHVYVNSTCPTLASIPTASLALRHKHTHLTFAVITNLYINGQRF